MTPNHFAPPKAPVADIAHGDGAPALWNPGAAANWSLLFSPVFGAFLHMKNWEALGQTDKAAAAKGWLVTTLVVIVGLSVAAAFMPTNRALGGILRLSGFGLLLLWYFAAGKPQVDFVKTHYGKQYPKKGWAVPLLIAVAAVVGFLFLVGVVAAGAVMARRT